MPRLPPSTAAERMRRMRERKRAAGLKEQHRWVERDSLESWSDHRVAEIRSLALHALVARKLSRDPRLLEHARANLDRWEEASKAAEGWVDEWRTVLGRPADQVAAFLVSTSEEAFRLRQSSPFAGALSHEERRALFDAFR